MFTKETDQAEDEVFNVFKYIPGVGTAYGLSRGVVYLLRGNGTQLGRSLVSSIPIIGPILDSQSQKKKQQEEVEKQKQQRIIQRREIQDREYEFQQKQKKIQQENERKEREYNNKLKKEKLAREQLEREKKQLEEKSRAQQIQIQQYPTKTYENSLLTNVYFGENSYQSSNFSQNQNEIYRNCLYLPQNQSPYYNQPRQQQISYFNQRQIQFNQSQPRQQQMSYSNQKQRNYY